MRVKAVSLFCLAVIMVVFGNLYAAEHGGKEHGGTSPVMKEHGGMQMAEPSKNDIHSAMRIYIDDKSAQSGALEVYDNVTGKTRRLELMRIHERVGKTGDYYYSCADFKDMDSGDMLDLDLDVENEDGKLGVVDVRIHKFNGKERYTYDANDNRIPVKE